MNPIARSIATFYTGSGATDGRLYFSEVIDVLSKLLDIETVPIYQNRGFVSIGARLIDEMLAIHSSPTMAAVST